MFFYYNKKLLLLLIFFSILSFSCQKAPTIIDIIQPVNLNSGKTDSLTISDIFYAENYNNIKLDINLNVNVKFNFDKTKLLLTPKLNFEGMTFIPLTFNDNTIQIPVRVHSLQYFTFTFNPKKKYKSVYLFGSFNGWNRANLKMNKIKGDFTTIISLEPGRYQYKFFADGEELLDPENPEKISNGMGGFNSVLNVNSKHKTQIFLHKLNSKLKDQEYKFSFFYSNIENNENIKPENIFALLNNTKIYPSSIKLNKNTITVTFKKNELNGKKILRLAVSQNGQTSNIQNIILFNGKPAGSDNKHFT